MLTYNSAFTLQTQLQNNNYQFQGRLFFGGWILNKYWGFVTKVPITLDILKTGCHLFKSPIHKHLFNMLWSPPCSKRVQFGSVQRLSRVRLFATPWMHARPPCPSPTPGVHWNSHLSSQWCHPAISSSVVPFSSCPQPLPASESFPISQLFASVIRWPKYWSFSFSIIPSKEHPGLISFRMDWLDLLAVQGTLKSLL